MLPDWELDETFERVAGHGIAALELRVRDNPPGNPAPSYWGRHVADVSPANFLQKVPAIRAAAARTGVRVCALAPRLWIDDQEVMDAVLAGAHARPIPKRRRWCASTRRDTAAAAPTRSNLPRCARASNGCCRRPGRLGVKLLYEIHVGTVAMSTGRAHALLDGLDSGSRRRHLRCPQHVTRRPGGHPPGHGAARPLPRLLPHRRLAPSPRRPRTHTGNGSGVGISVPLKRASPTSRR